MKTLKWVVGVPAVLVVFVVALSFALHAATPEYEREARKVRRACEQSAAPHQHYVCEDQYEKALAEGRRSRQP